MFRLIIPLLVLLLPFGAQAADDVRGVLPESGVKSPYSPLAVPTEMKPLSASLASLLDRGFEIHTTTQVGAELVLTLSHRGAFILCALTPPDPRTDQAVPSSRCWALNKDREKR